MISKAKILKKGLLGALALAIITSGVALIGCVTGQKAEDSAVQTSAEIRQARMESAANWRDGKFVNGLPGQLKITLAGMWKFLTADNNREPDSPPPVVTRRAAEFAGGPESGLRVTWLGHSTMLLEIDGARLLLDPVWGERASPFSFAGPRRFHEPPLPLDELLKLNIDAVVISHNHYDHLDEPTIRALKATPVRFIVPLGVGATFEEWGVAPERITELNWWQETRVRGLTVTATPARHSSGRAVNMSDRDESLWASWAFTGPKHRVFFSGDTAMFPGFKKIGERLGPFDLTMLEVGAYNPQWADMHMGPEQAVQAHRHLRGRVMLPIHWGTFDLALHAWTEPVERTLIAARESNIRVVTPRPGGSVEPARSVLTARWWPEVPHQTAEETPILSSGLEGEGKSSEEKTVGYTGKTPAGAEAF